MRNWLGKHVATLVSATSSVLVAALIATVAVVSNGYPAQRLDLGDGAVWVANSGQQAIGRVATEVLELNTVVETEGDDLQVLQRGETVLLFDRAESTIEIVDPATSEVVDSIALPPNRPEVHLAGDRVIVHEVGTGEVWIVPLADLETLRRRGRIVPEPRRGCGAERRPRRTALRTRPRDLTALPRRHRELGCR